MTDEPGTRVRRRRSTGRRRFAALALLTPLTLVACVKPDVPVGLRVTQEPESWAQSPDSLEQMRQLETQIVESSQLAISTTVGVRVGENQGSGVIVSEDGLVLTAWHVIGEAELPAVIYMPDGRRLRGTTLESNPSRDSGMIRIDAPGPFSYAEVLDDGDAAIGTWCMATGHPGGFERGRPPVLRVGRVVSYRQGFLQSDCPIFSGDSGGPLFDLAGRVIGIHSRIRENLSFNLHVPTSAFVRDWNFLVASGPLLGVEGENERGGGARITYIFPDRPADLVNLAIGDVILRFGDHEVADMNRLAELVRASQVGQRVELLIRRGEREFTVEPRLASREGGL